MDKEEIYKLIKRQRLEDNLKQDFSLTLNDRITRYFELDFIKITPNTHFASISAECILLYRDGYYLACIAFHCLSAIYFAHSSHYNGKCTNQLQALFVTSSLYRCDPDE